MILLFGGTSDSIEIAKGIARSGASVTISTATGYGLEIAQGTGEPRIQAVCERLDAKGMADLAKSIGACCIIDATHPFAVDVSRNAIACANELDLPHARYERRLTGNTQGAVRVSSIEEAVKWLEDTDGDVLLSTGSKNIEAFAERLDVKRLHARVLPTAEAVAKCERLGFSPDRIIGMKGPFSEEMNRIIIRERGIRHVVTKDSGERGGTAQKISAAKAEGASVVLIEREKMDYPVVFCDIEGAVGFALSNGDAIQGGDVL